MDTFAHRMRYRLSTLAFVWWRQHPGPISTVVRDRSKYIKKKRVAMFEIMPSHGSFCSIFLCSSIIHSAFNTRRSLVCETTVNIRWGQGMVQINVSRDKGRRPFPYNRMTEIKPVRFPCAEGKRGGLQ